MTGTVISMAALCAMCYGFERLVVLLLRLAVRKLNKGTDMEDWI